MREEQSSGESAATQVFKGLQGIQCDWSRSRGGVGEGPRKLIRHNILEASAAMVKTLDFSLREMGSHGGG